jgi:hypothetical protein
MSATRSRLGLPKYVHGWVDKRGGGAKARHYFCRPGFKRVPLPGLPWSPEFMAAYEAAMAGQPPIEIGSKRTVPGTVNAAVIAYFSSAAFLQLAPATRANRRAILERFREAHGDKRIAKLERKHLEIILAGKAGTPWAARNWFKVIRGLCQFAHANGIIPADPTIGMKTPKANQTDGFHTWTEEEIAAFEARYPIGTKARLAMALMLYVSGRRADAVVLGPQHIRNGLLTYTQ